jgi:hypothetical protein
MIGMGDFDIGEVTHSYVSIFGFYQNFIINIG